MESETVRLADLYVRFPTTFHSVKVVKTEQISVVKTELGGYSEQKVWSLNPCKQILVVKREFGG